MASQHEFTPTPWNRRPLVEFVKAEDGSIEVRRFGAHEPYVDPEAEELAELDDVMAERPTWWDDREYEDEDDWRVGRW